MIYLDTNVFIYASDIQSRFYTSSVKLLKQIIIGEKTASTSTETIQEIIHAAKKLNQLNRGIKLGRNLLKIISSPYPIDLQVIKTYIKLSAKYTSLESRDLIHLSVCLSNHIPVLVTEDFKLRKLKINSVAIVSIDQALVSK